MAAAGLAVWKGGWRERTLALYQLALWAGFRTCYMLKCPLVAWEVRSLVGGAWVEFATDVGLLILCVICARRSDRYWIIWAGSIAVLYLVTDVLALTHALSRWTFWSAIVIWNYVFNGVLLWGVWSFQQQRRRPARAEA